jgi:hypothetical protein
VEQGDEVWRRLSDAARKMSPEELADLLASSYSGDTAFGDLRCGPLLAVLDTSNVMVFTASSRMAHLPRRSPRATARCACSWSTRR